MKILAWVFLGFSLHAKNFEDFSSKVPLLSTPPMESQIHARLYKQIDTSASTLAGKGTEAVYAPSCAKVEKPSWTISKERTLASPSKAKLNLTKKNPSFEEISALLRSTSLGTKLMDRFLPKWNAPYKVLSNTSFKSPKVAQYIPSEKTIYYSPYENLGDIGFILAHEMVHSLDPDHETALQKEQKLWNGFDDEAERIAEETAERTRKKIGQIDRYDLEKKDFEYLVLLRKDLEEFSQIRIFRAERFAYDFTLDLWKELSQAYPEYYHNPRNQPPDYYSNETLIKILGLSPTVISKFLSSKCRTKAL